MSAITIAVLNALLWEKKQMHSVTETGELSAEKYATGCPWNYVFIILGITLTRFIFLTVIN